MLSNKPNFFSAWILSFSLSILLLLLPYLLQIIEITNDLSKIHNILGFANFLFLLHST